MTIDWFTVAAQAVNFLILVGLLRRFLYRPVLAAIDARERLVAARLADAATARESAEHERTALETQQQQLESGRAGVMQATLDAATKQAQEIAAAAAAQAR